MALALYFVAVSAAILGRNHISDRGQIVNDPLHRALRDAYRHRKFSHARVRLLSNRRQYVRVVGEQSEFVRG